MRKRKLETLQLIQQVQQTAIACLEKTSCRSNKEVYEAAIMKQYQISYSTFLEYMKEANVSDLIAEYDAKRPESV